MFVCTFCGCFCYCSYIPRTKYKKHNLSVLVCFVGKSFVLTIGNYENRQQTDDMTNTDNTYQINGSQHQKKTTAMEEDFNEYSRD